MEHDVIMAASILSSPHAIAVIGYATGGNFALAAAQALIQNTKLTVRDMHRRARTNSSMYNRRT